MGRALRAEGVAEASVPCYFNTGCCSFRNGHITGLELTEGQIRLIRWTNDSIRRHARILASPPLRDVLAACR